MFAGQDLLENLDISAAQAGEDDQVSLQTITIDLSILSSLSGKRHLPSYREHDGNVTAGGSVV